MASAPRVHLFDPPPFPGDVRRRFAEAAARALVEGGQSLVLARNYRGAFHRLAAEATFLPDRWRVIDVDVDPDETLRRRLPKLASEALSLSGAFVGLKHPIAGLVTATTDVVIDRVIAGSSTGVGRSSPPADMVDLYWELLRAAVAEGPTIVLIDLADPGLAPLTLAALGSALRHEEFASVPLLVVLGASEAVAASCGIDLPSPGQIGRGTAHGVDHVVVDCPYLDERGLGQWLGRTAKPAADLILAVTGGEDERTWSIVEDWTASGALRVRWGVLREASPARSEAIREFERTLALLGLHPAVRRAVEVAIVFGDQFPEEVVVRCAIEDAEAAEEARLALGSRIFRPAGDGRGEWVSSLMRSYLLRDLLRQQRPHALELTNTIWAELQRSGAMAEFQDEAALLGRRMAFADWARQLADAVSKEIEVLRRGLFLELLASVVEPSWDFTEELVDAVIVLTRQGHFPLAVRLSSLALGRAKVLDEVRPEQSYRVHRVAGSCLCEHGDFDVGIVALRTSLEIARGMGVTAGGGGREEVGGALVTISQAFFDRDVGEAASALKEAVPLLEGVVAEAPSTTARIDLALALYRLGGLDVRGGHLAAGQTLISRSVSILRAVAEKAGLAIDLHLHLARALRDLAHLELELGNASAGGPLLSEAIDIGRSVVRSNPTVGTWHQLAWTLFDAARRLPAEEAHPFVAEAVSCYRAAAHIEASVDNLDRLAWAAGRWGEIAANLGLYQVAFDAYAEAIECARQLIGSMTTLTDWTDLPSLLQAGAEVALQMGDWQTGSQLVWEALSEYLRANAVGESRTFLHQFLNILVWASIHPAFAAVDERSELTENVHRWRELLGVADGDVEVVDAIASTLLALARRPLIGDDWSVAKHIFLEAARLRRHLVSARPTAAALVELTSMLREAAREAAFADDLDEASDLYDEAALASHRALLLDPDRIDELFSWWRALVEAAEVAQRLGRPDDRTARLDAAVAVARALVAADRSRGHLMALAMTLREAGHVVEEGGVGDRAGAIWVEFADVVAAAVEGLAGADRVQVEEIRRSAARVPRPTTHRALVDGVCEQAQQLVDACRRSD